MNGTRLFVSYAHEDEFWRDLLLTHMAILETNGMIHVWADSRIEIGADWRLRIQEALDDSRMAILLLSSSFLRSTFIIGTEVPALMKAHIERGMEVLPVIVRPCAWKLVDWIARKQVRPKNGRALALGGVVQADVDLTALTYEVSALLNIIDSDLAAEEVATAEAARDIRVTGPTYWRDNRELRDVAQPHEVDLAFTSLERLADQLRNEAERTRTVSIIIAEALKYGVPLYNGGSPTACALVYYHAVTLIRDLILQKADVNNEYFRKAQQALSSLPPMHAINSRNANSMSWQLRHILDDVSAGQTR